VDQKPAKELVVPPYGLLPGQQIHERLQSHRLVAPAHPALVHAGRLRLDGEVVKCSDEEAVSTAGRASRAGATLKEGRAVRLLKCVDAVVELCLPLDRA
jgi:hypothetical protein